MKKIIVLLLLICVPSAYCQNRFTLLSDTAKNLPAKKLTLKENPKVEIGNVAKELAAGYSLGLLFGLVLTGAAYGLGGGAGHGGGGNEVFSLLMIGHSIGSIFGVNVGNSSENVSGNLWLSIAGGAAGSVGSFYYFSNKKETNLGDFFIAATFPTVGAAIGYNSMLRYNDKKFENETREMNSRLKIKNNFEVTVMKINF